MNQRINRRIFYVSLKYLSVMMNALHGKNKFNCALPNKTIKQINVNVNAIQSNLNYEFELFAKFGKQK